MVAADPDGPNWGQSMTRLLAPALRLTLLVDSLLARLDVRKEA
jgi:hypothetical protein